MRLHDLAPTLIRGTLPSGAPPCMLELEMPGGGRQSQCSRRLFYDPSDLVSRIKHWLDCAAVFYGNQYSNMGLAPLCINGTIKVGETVE